MPTVDDLIISLTIKPSSQLGELKKQLDALVGKKGVKIPEMGLPTATKNDIAFIKDKIKWLRPNILPTKETPKELRIVAGSIMKDIEDFKTLMSSKVMKVRAQDFETLQEEFATESADEILEGIEGVMDQVKEKVQDIFLDASELPPHKQEELIHLLHRLLAEAMSKREIGLQFWRALTEAEPEKIWGKKVMKYMKALGGTVYPEKGIYKVKPSAIVEHKEIREKLGLGAMTKEQLRDLGTVLVSKEMKGELDKIYQQITGTKLVATQGAKRIDIAVTKDFDKVAKAMGLKGEWKGVEVGVELKKILRESNINQILDYVKYFGEDKFFVFTEQLAGDVLDKLDAYGLKDVVKVIPNIRGALESVGKAQTLIMTTSEDFENTMADLQEQTKEADDTIDDLADNIQAQQEMAEEEQRQEDEKIEDVSQKSEEEKKTDMDTLANFLSGWEDEQEDELKTIGEFSMEAAQNTQRIEEITGHIGDIERDITEVPAEINNIKNQIEEIRQQQELEGKDVSEKLKKILEEVLNIKKNMRGEQPPQSGGFED